MKCPTCRRTAKVTRTSVLASGQIKRQRTCSKLHVFETVEVLFKEPATTPWQSTEPEHEPA
jgi:transcriptional regulator NrdR family protein